MRIAKLIQVWVVLGLIMTPGELLGANCPYCGRSYGEAAPGDEVRVYGLRTAHESSCPSRSDPGRGGWTTASYGVVTIYNPNNREITYKIRKRRGGPWHTARVKANGSYYHWQSHPVNFQIRFDASVEPGYQEKSYSLDCNTITGRKPRPKEGKKYELTISGGDIDLQVASDKTKETYATYGVVTIVNETDQSINYQIKYTRYGSWGETTTVGAKSTYYHWVELPASFAIKFDRSFSEGYQRKTVKLKHNEIKGRKPTANDGRDYRLTSKGTRLGLSASKAKNHKMASLTADDVSMVGTGHGQTKKETFGNATRAKGTATLTYMPRINGAIPTEEGSWKAKMIEETTSPENAPYKTQVWEFKSKTFGVATATIQGSPTGASGTATGWYSPIPGNPGGEKFRITFGVQFSGRQISLTNFAKSF